MAGVDEERLSAVAQQLARPGTGLLASDESTGTIGKRFEKLGVENTEENRRNYRELLYTADIGSAISGVIMFEETLHQSASCGTPFVRVLADKGVLSGIKVDHGLAPLPHSPEETFTKGLDTLEARCKGYVEAGATFAKWRSALKIDGAKGLPSAGAVRRNADDLALYALTCQRCGLVPIVEPEILINGAHSMADFARVSEIVLAATVQSLQAHGVFLEGCLLKPQMVIPGDKCPDAKPSADAVAAATLAVLRRTIPPAVPGIMFLSGGQSEREASVNLNAISAAAREHGGAPWTLSFSYGRGLQASVLDMWARDPSRKDECRRMAAALAAANAAAQRGDYADPHPSGLQGDSLVEGFRGWSAQPAQA